VLLLLSPEAMSSAWVTWEVRYALERHLDLGWKSRIVPVIVSRRRETLELIRSSPLERIGDVQALDLSAGEIDEKVAKLTHILARH
jgi:TIR domain